MCCTMRLQQIVQPGRPGAFFPGSHGCLALQTVRETAECCWLWFRLTDLHHQLPALILDGDHNGFLMHVHSEIIDARNLI